MDDSVPAGAAGGSDSGCCRNGSVGVLVIARRYVVYGRVQGVGFRFWTLRMAEQRGVRGWVRNRRNGTVEVHAEGESGAVGDLERLLNAGPPASSVTKVDAMSADLAGLDSFSVEPTT